MRILVLENHLEDAKETKNLLSKLGIQSAEVTELQTQSGSLRKVRHKDYPGLVILTAETLNNDLLQHLKDDKLSFEDVASNGELPSPAVTFSTLKIKKRFLIKQGTKLISVKTENIAYFYSNNRLNYLRTWDNRSYIVNYTMEDLMELLPAQDFFRISRSHIISYKSVAEVHTHFHSRLKLKLHVACNDELFVSKEKVGEFKKWIGG